MRTMQSSCLMKTWKPAHVSYYITTFISFLKGNFLEGEFRVGDFIGGDSPEGECPVVVFSVGIFLEPGERGNFPRTRWKGNKV